MTSDAIDDILEQWSAQRPELDTASLGVVIRVLALNRAFVRQATTALKPLDLELYEYDVLAVLRRQGKPYRLGATALARQAGLSSGAMTNRIDRLEDRSLVRRSADPADRRGVNVTLTGAGRHAVDEAIRLRLQAADESLCGLTAPQRHRLAALLRKVVLTMSD